MKHWEVAMKLLGDRWVILNKDGYYWGPDRGGYTSSLWTAGLYSEEEAKQIEWSCKGRGDVAKPAREQFEHNHDTYVRAKTLADEVLSEVQCLHGHFTLARAFLTQAENEQTPPMLVENHGIHYWHLAAKMDDEARQRLIDCKVRSAMLEAVKRVEKLDPSARPAFDVLTDVLAILHDLAPVAQG